MDVVVPVAAKDLHKLPGCIDGILRNSATPLHRVYIIARGSSESTPRPKLTGLPVTWIDEARYPFTIDEITEHLRHKGSVHPHASWYFQQLLKLYAYRVIPDLLDRVLILDSDCHFTQRVPFSTSSGKALLAYGYPFEWQLGIAEHEPEVTHEHARFARRLLPGWSPQSRWSGMHHHIVLDRDILEELLTEVERAHAQEFWGAFIHAVDVTKWNAASEYILYYHYALWRHPERVESRHLTACDIICDADDRFDAQAAMTSLCDGGAYQVVGCHDFLDLRERLQTMDYIPDALKRVLAGSSAPALLLFLRDGALRLEEYSSPSAPPQTMR